MKDHNNRKHIRLRTHDYSKDGYYFVTICTQNAAGYFGEIRNGVMGLNKIGYIAHEQWKQTGELRDNVILDEFVVMPNHVHGIIVIQNPHMVGPHCNAALPYGDLYKPNQFGPQKNNLASIVRGFKSSVKRICNQKGFTFFWQPRYYERIIRNEEELFYVRRYIRNNPLKWKKSNEN